MWLYTRLLHYYRLHNGLYTAYGPGINYICIVYRVTKLRNSDSMTQHILPYFAPLNPIECHQEFKRLLNGSDIPEQDLVSLLEYLIDNKRIDLNNRTTLWLITMIHYEKPKLVDVLLAKNANVHLGNSIGITPIIKAVMRAAFAPGIHNEMRYIIRKLVEKDPTLLRTTRSGLNLLFMSWTANPKLSQVEFLLDLGFDINMTVSLKKTVTEDHIPLIHIRHFSMLFWAIATDDTDLFNVLIRRGANPNVRADIEIVQRNTSLHLSVLDFAIDYQDIPATPRNNFRIIETLLRAGADVNARDNCGRTCLWYAMNEKSANTAISLELIDLLLQFGADPNAKCNEQYGHSSPLEIANPAMVVHMKMRIEERTLPIRQVLKSRGIPVELENLMMPALTILP